MNNSKAIFQDFVRQITLTADAEEVSAITYFVFEKLFGLTRTDILRDKQFPLSESQKTALKNVIRRINDHEPVQYILGEAIFFGRKFLVNPSVLIPRPETEELIIEVLVHVKAHNKKEPIKVLDIGTGSGCIPITLSLEIPGSELYATDISQDALHVAKQNSKMHGANVSFVLHDILKEDIPFPGLDVVVSNPPYVTFSEKGKMKSNVVDHEPHLALFVPENDALIFYKALAVKGFDALKNQGSLCVEINERFGREVSELFSRAGFREVKILKDISEKDRIVSGIK
jgi:release factor glutamine methyltransferase